MTKMNMKYKCIVGGKEIQNLNKRLYDTQLLEWIDCESDPIVALCLLRGGVFFFSDITRLMPFDKVEIAFCSCSSYGDSKESSGEVKITGLSCDVSGKRVLVIDDIYDTGLTIESVSSRLYHMGASEVRSCTFARRANRAGKRPDFSALVVEPDAWLIGYGMDDAGLSSNSSSIVVKV